MRLSATRLTSIAQAGGGRTLIQRAISVLRRYGQDAHIYLPGVGMLNGLQAANYLDSSGTTAATVDQPVGLVLDTAGSLGVELVTNGTFDANITGWTAQFTSTASWQTGQLRSVSSGTNAGEVSAAITTVIGKTYKCDGQITVVTSNARIGAAVLQYGATLGSTGYQSASGTYSFFFTATATTTYIVVGLSSGTNGVYSDFDNISVREVTGIAASQPTTANKSVLKLTSGRYNWLFDATDLLTATYPAGYESVTVIDARSTGQVTTAGANIVGAYSMGPSVTLYGRMIIRVAVSPSDLALLQGFANRLAGL